MSRYSAAAAGQVASLNNNAFSLAQQQGGILGAVGDAQQQQQQAEFNAAYQNWQLGKQLTLQQQNLLNASLGMIPVQQTTTMDGTKTTSTNPGLVGILGGLGSFAGGIGQLGGSGGLGSVLTALSDARAKADIETLGYDAKKRRWVTFRYHWEPEDVRHAGVLAQEILQSDPDAIHMGNDGLYRVDYSRLQ